MTKYVVSDEYSKLNTRIKNLILNWYLNVLTAATTHKRIRFVKLFRMMYRTTVMVLIRHDKWDRISKNEDSILNGKSDKYPKHGKYCLLYGNIRFTVLSDACIYIYNRFNHNQGQFVAISLENVMNDILIEKHGFENLSNSDDTARAVSD